MGNFSTTISEQPSNDSVGALHHTDAEGIVLDTKNNVPFSQYQKVNREPYSTKYFNVQDYIHLNDVLDVYETREKLQTVDDYIKSLIKDRGLSDTIQSYQQLMNEIESSLHIEKNDEDRLSKVNTFIQMLRRGKELSRKRSLV